MTITEKRKKLACICFSGRGRGLAERLLQRLAGWDWSIVVGYGADKVSLHGWTAECFAQADALLFVGAAGIAVRAVAPHLRNKMTDPAVLVMDEAGRYVIPLLSGHVGGANRLAKELAVIGGGKAVLTTATDVHGVFAVDDWAARQGLAIINPVRIKEISARLLRGEQVSFFSLFPVEGDMPFGLTHAGQAVDGDICITPYGHPKGLQLAPRCVAVGVGCRKGASPEAIEGAIVAALVEKDLCVQSVCGIYSIDVKAREAGILACCEKYGWPFVTYTAARLEEVSGSGSPSPFVMETVGVDNVCERSALAEGGELILSKRARDGVTIALAFRDIILKFGEE